MTHHNEKSSHLKVCSIEKRKVSLQSEIPFGAVTLTFTKMITGVRVKCTMNYNKAISHRATFGWKITFARMGSFVIINFRKVLKWINAIVGIKRSNFLYCSLCLLMNYITINDIRLTYVLIKVLVGWTNAGWHSFTVPSRSELFVRCVSWVTAHVRPFGLASKHCCHTISLGHLKDSSCLIHCCSKDIRKSLLLAKKRSKSICGTRARGWVQVDV